MENGVKHKLLGYEVPPPPGLWQKIADDLDASELSSEYPRKLYEMEVAPPSSAWQKIASALYGQNEQAPASRGKLVPIFKYAAAAAILAALVFGGSRLLNGNKNEEIATQQTEEKSVPSEIRANPQPESNEELVTTTTEEADDAALEASKTTVAKLERIPDRKLLSISRSYFSGPIETAILDENLKPEETYREPSLAEISEPIFAEHSDIDPANRYLVMMTPEGNIIRISKKWSSLLCCVAGEEQDQDCKDQLKRWRDKLAFSTQASGNFMDVLSLLSSLQDNH